MITKLKQKDNYYDDIFVNARLAFDVVRLANSHGGILKMEAISQHVYLIRAISLQCIPGSRSGNGS